MYLVLYSLRGRDAICNWYCTVYGVRMLHVTGTETVYGVGMLHVTITVTVYGVKVRLQL